MVVALVAAAPAVVVVGCSIDVSEPSLTSWQANLQPIPPSGVAGSAAVLSRSDNSEVSIAMTGGEEGVAYAWNLRTGSCQGQGSLLGGQAIYPGLVADETGEDDVATIIIPTLHSGSHAAWLFQMVGDDEVPVACGELEQVG